MAYYSVGFGGLTVRGRSSSSSSSSRSSRSSSIVVVVVKLSDSL